MIRLRYGSFSLSLVLVATVVACGKKGPPLAPLYPVPGRVEMTVRRLEDDVYLRLVVPSANRDGTKPADLEEIEIYAFTDDSKVEPLDNQDVVRRNDLRIATIAIRPPPAPEPETNESEDENAPEKKAPAAPPAPEDPRPEQGSSTTYHERLTETYRTPVVRPRDKSKAATEVQALPKVVPPFVGHLLPDAPLVRYYFAVGVSTAGRRGPFPPRRTVPLVPPPPAPLTVTLNSTEQHVEVSWDEPPGAPQRIQQPPSQGELRVRRSVLPEPPLFGYNVYDATVDPPVDIPIRLNEAPLDTTTFQDDQLEFGKERCYVVRTVHPRGGMPVESAPSPRQCVTRTDVFAPAAPKNLTAVGTEGGISLIWEPVDVADLGGYLVLRGEAGSETLQPVTPSPLSETTYRDALQPGVRYVYAVVAVDKTGNRSAESNRVEELAR